MADRRRRKVGKARQQLQQIQDNNVPWDLHEYGLNVLHRELYLVGEPDAGMMENDRGEPGVEYSMASRLIKNLRLLSLMGTDPILIHMKTCGGDLHEGFAIYDAVMACQCPVVVLSYTHARSMSSIILQAAAKRVLMPHSYFMFHRGSYQYEGEARAVESGVEFFKAYHARMIDTYVEGIKRAERGPYWRWGRQRLAEKFNGMMNSLVDVFLTAKEAVAWGLADEIFDGDWGRLKVVSSA